MSRTKTRRRTHEWTEPGTLAAATREMSGSDYLAAWKQGDLIPPIAATLGFHLTHFGDGEVEIGCTPEEFHYNPYGMLHGGLAATLLDSATACAVHTRLPAGTGYVTLGINVGYLRPITIETGPLRCRGRVTSLGSRVAFAEAELIDGRDRRLAQATATCLILKPD